MLLDVRAHKQAIPAAHSCPCLTNQPFDPDPCPNSLSCTLAESKLHHRGKSCSLQGALVVRVGGEVAIHQIAHEQIEQVALALPISKCVRALKTAAGCELMACFNAASAAGSCWRMSAHMAYHAKFISGIL